MEREPEQLPAMDRNTQDSQSVLFQRLIVMLTDDW